MWTKPDVFIPESVHGWVSPHSRIQLGLKVHTRDERQQCESCSAASTEVAKGSLGPIVLKKSLSGEDRNISGLYRLGSKFWPKGGSWIAARATWGSQAARGGKCRTSSRILARRAKNSPLPDFDFFNKIGRE